MYDDTGFSISQFRKRMLHHVSERAACAYFHKLLLATVHYGTVGVVYPFWSVFQNPEYVLPVRYAAVILDKLYETAPGDARLLDYDHVGGDAGVLRDVCGQIGGSFSSHPGAASVVSGRAGVSVYLHTVQSPFPVGVLQTSDKTVHRRGVLLQVGLESGVAHLEVYQYLIGSTCWTADIGLCRSDGREQHGKCDRCGKSENYARTFHRF